MKSMGYQSVAKQYGTPLFVYHGDKVRDNYRAIRGAFPYPDIRILYAAMANYQPFIFEIIDEMVGDVHVSSVKALEYVMERGFKPERLSFTSTGTEDVDLERLCKEGVQVNFESLEDIEDYGKAAKKFGKGGLVNGIRVYTGDLDVPNGVTNSNKNSNIGVYPEDIQEAKSIAKAFGLRLGGVHGYLASNISDPKYFKTFADYLTEIALGFEDLEYVNFGSGFGLKLDLEEVGKYYSKKVGDLSENFGRNLRLEIEPGRRLVGNAGILLTRVTKVKPLRDGRKCVSVNVGFGEFARPYIYGPEERGHHDIVAVCLESAKSKSSCDVRAATVLQSDVLGWQRMLPQVKRGDILGIMDAGAYAMASGFPDPPPPNTKHVLI